jgi:hypothetical protein
MSHRAKSLVLANGKAIFSAEQNLCMSDSTHRCENVKKRIFKAICEGEATDKENTLIDHIEFHKIYSSTIKQLN